MGVSNYKTDLQKLIGYSINPSNPISTRYCMDISFASPGYWSDTLCSNNIKFICESNWSINQKLY